MGPILFFSIFSSLNNKASIRVWDLFTKPDEWILLKSSHQGLKLEGSLRTKERPTVMDNVRRAVS